jgi:hypothetical protein
MTLPRASRAMPFVLLLAAAPVAAQDALPAPASDSVQVELNAFGTAEVPAQAYRVSGLVGAWPSQNGSPPLSAADRAAIEAQLEELEMRERESCLPSYPMGFVGNEIELAAAIDAEETGEAGEAGEGQAAPATPRAYTGLFATRDRAEQARALIGRHASFPVQVQAVLFDCDASHESATLDALRKSRAEADRLARSLQLRNAGVVSISETAADYSVAMLSAFQSMRSGELTETVTVNAALKVTYRFER